MKQNRFIPGDWVNFKGKLARIEETYSTNYFVKECHNDYNPDIEYDDAYFFREARPVDIEPIPLTPEILEKNGVWKKSKASDRTLLYYKDEVYIQYDMSDMFFYFADFEYRDSIIELKYVHQLQHLLFGLGLDSEFKLDMPSWCDGKYCTKINRQDK